MICLLNRWNGKIDGTERPESRPEGNSYTQHAVAARDAGRASAHRLQYRCLVERLEKGVELRAGAGELNGVGVLGDIDDPAAEDVGRAFHLLAVLAGGAHLDQHEFALDVRR